MFAGPERAFVPTVSRDKAQRKVLTETTATPLSRLPAYVVSALVLWEMLIQRRNRNQDLGKEEKILSGTFHDGDSE